jgi:uncharacterized protein YbbC (DUF1343 family)
MFNTRLLALPVVAIWSAIAPAGLAFYSESCPQGQVYSHGQDHMVSPCPVSADQPRSAIRNAAVMNGVDVLEHDNFKELRASDPSTVRTVGIITNHTGFDLEGRRTIDILAKAPGIRLTAIFSPEHGITGELDVDSVGNSVDRTTGVPVYSIYGETVASRHPPENVLKKLNLLVIDIQDIGSRFYTYESTLGYALESAAATGTEVVVLDRPNPLTGIYVQGPVSDGNHLSFVDYTTEPIRHGMTMGELARMFNSERRINAKLTVVPIQGWERGDWFDSTGLVWVNLSPNMRNMNEAALYTGVGIVEYTNVSVGRGTDTPFEIFGAPWIEPREFSRYLNARNIPGVRFVPTWFTPEKGSKFGGQRLGGVQMIVLDRAILDAPELGLELASAMWKLYPNDWDTTRLIELLGSDVILEDLKGGIDARCIAAEYQADLRNFMQIRQKYLIYGGS